ncbi:winged helix-turn-helix transcriptional regulator [Herbiconiux solani]|uniref:winged helix-turn-helix transcriptional regulator n=1 Tax=Herbiconiux solani TaxID=661329 RepID=UPI000A068A73|nr:helix-turn-helix domain-containing protein [Herbiconiux solani]
MTAEDGTFDTPGHLSVTTGADAHRGDLFSRDCPTRQLLDRIGGKWVSMAVKVLGDEYPGEVRFAELKRRMPGISQKMLAQTLRSLERDTLVARRVEATTPPRVHYRLTDLGYSLTEPIAALRDWAELHMAQIDAANAG